MAATPSSPTPSPSSHSSTPQPGGQRRRDFLELPVRLAAAGVAGALSAALQEKEPPEQEKKTTETKASEKHEVSRSVDFSGAPSSEAWEAGELSYNWTRSYVECYALLDIAQIVLLDQNGKIIDEDFITIPESLLAFQHKPDFQRRFQVWMKKMRDDIKKRYPTLYVNHEQDEPTLVNIRTIFEQGKMERDTSFLDLVWRNSHKPVSKKNKESRYSFLKKRLSQSELPPELQTIALGLVGIESKYLDMPENGAGAAGAFQIMRDEAREAKPPLLGVRQVEKTIMVGRGRRKKPKKITDHVPFDDRLDFEKASKRFIELFAARYKLVKNNKYVNELQRRFGLSESDIVYPLILNTYHSGVGLNITGYTDKRKSVTEGEKKWNRILRQEGDKTIIKYDGMCKWFLENVLEGQVEKILGAGPYGEDIFNLMVTLYAQNEVDADFRKASRAYYRKSRAMAELLKMKEIEEANPKDIGKIVEFSADDGRLYVPPALPRPPEPPKAQESQKPPTGKAVIDGTRASIALIAGAAGHLVAEELRNPKPTNRRTHLKRLARATGSLVSAAAATIIGKGLSRGKKEKAPPRKEIDVDYKNIPQLNEVAVRAALQEELSKAGALAPKAQPDDIKTLDTSTIFAYLRDPPLFGIAVAEKNGLTGFDRDSDIKNGEHMRAVPLESPWLRLRGVGIADDTEIKDEAPISEQNDPRFAYLRNFALETLQEISHELNRRLLIDYGMPQRFRIRIVGTSLSRSREFHKKVQKGHRRYAAKRDSPHIFGHTFDLSRFRYDLIDTTTNTYCRINIGSPEGSVENSFSLVRTINAVLGRIILEMKQKGKILVIWEDANAVYHISVILNVV